MTTSRSNSKQDKLNFFIIRLLVLCVFASAAPAFAREWWTASFFLDNDLFAESDDGYTNGIRLSFVSPDLSDFEEDPLLPDWLKSVNRRLSFFRASETDLQRNMVVTVGQQMYTPDEDFIDETALVEEARPYAGWLYLGFGYQVSNYLRLETAVVNIGVVGPASLAEESQNAVHDFRGFDRFQGWDNQLNNELGLQVIYRQKNKLFQQSTQSGWGHDFISHWGGSLGNVATYLETGGEWRFGWQLPRDFGTSSASPGGDNSSPGSVFDNRVRKKAFGGVHAFVALNGRWVFHDITLDGNTFSDSHSVDKESLVGSASVGVATTLYNWKLGFSRRFVTDEFKGQLDEYGYGAVTLSYTYAF
jgi:hypothetical protein